MSETPEKQIPHTKVSQQRNIEGGIKSQPQLSHNTKQNSHYHQQEYTETLQRSATHNAQYDGEVGNDAIVEYSPHGTWLTWLKSVSDTPRSRRNNNTSNNQNQSVRVYERQALRLPGNNSPSNKPNKNVSNNMKNIDDIVSNETERTTAESAAHYDQRQRKSFVKKQTLPIVEQPMMSRIESVSKDNFCAASSDIKVKPLDWRLNFFHKYIWLPIKRHPYSVAIVCSFIAIISLGLLVGVFWWLIPMLIQTYLNYTNIHIQSAVISDPQLSSFYLSAKSIIEKPNFKPAHVDQFKADIYYVPQVVLRERRNFSKHLRLLDDTSITTRTKVHDPKDYFMDESVFKKYYIGSMIIPEMDLKEGINELDFSGRFQIVKPDYTSDFIKDLLSSSTATWLIQGNPSIKVMGLKHYNFNLLKALHFKGLQLQNNSSQSDNLDRSSKTSDSTFNSSMTVTHIDFTGEKKLKGIVEAQIVVPHDSITLKDLGQIEFIAYYKKRNFLNFRTINNISLKPGVNIIELETIQTNNYSEQVPVGLIQDIINSNSKDEPAVIKTRGSSSSIDLYLQAIKDLVFDVPIGPVKLPVGNVYKVSAKYLDMRYDEVKDTVSLILVEKHEVLNVFGKNYLFKVNKSDIYGDMQIAGTQLNSVVGKVTSEGRSKSLRIEDIGLITANVQEVVIRQEHLFVKEEDLNIIRDLIRTGLNYETVDLKFNYYSSKLDVDFNKTLMSFNDLHFIYRYQVKGINDLFSSARYKYLKNENKIKMLYDNKSDITFSAGTVDLYIITKKGYISKYTCENFQVKLGSNQLEFKHITMTLNPNNPSTQIYLKTDTKSPFSELFQDIRIPLSSELYTQMIDVE